LNTGEDELSTINARNKSAISPRRRAIWERLRRDAEMLGRLRVTQEELNAIERCSLLGAITCKQDFLFILKQIRNDSLSSERQEPAAFGRVDSGKIAPVKTARRMNRAMRQNAFAPASSSESFSFGQMIYHRGIEQVGALLCALLLIGFVLWNLLAGVLAWRQHFLRQLAAAQCPAPIVQTTAPRQVPPLGSARL